MYIADKKRLIRFHPSIFLHFTPVLTSTNALFIAGSSKDVYVYYMKPYSLRTILLSLSLSLTSCDTTEPEQELLYCDYVEVAEDGSASITVQDFCRFSDCYWNTTDFEDQFETCEELEWDYYKCWKRFEGCGLIQYEAAHDESFYYMASYNAENGQLIGIVTGNDYEPYCEGANQKETIGHVGIALTQKWENDCSSIKETYCCNAN